MFASPTSDALIAEAVGVALEDVELELVSEPATQWA